MTQCGFDESNYIVCIGVVEHVQTALIIELWSVPAAETIL